MNDLHSPALSEIFKRACQKRRAVHLVHVTLNLLQKVQWIQKLWDPVFISSVSHTPAVCLWRAGKLSEGLQASWRHCWKAPIKLLCIEVHQSHGGIGGCQPTLNRAMEMQYFSNLLTSGELFLPSESSCNIPNQGVVSIHLSQKRWDSWFPGQFPQSPLVSFTSNSNSFFFYLPCLLVYLSILEQTENKYQGSILDRRRQDN